MQRPDLQLVERSLAVVAVLGALLVVLLPPWTAAQDLPNWLVTSNVHLHPERYPHLRPNVPATQLVFNAALVGLGTVVPLHVAAKLVLAGGLLGWCAAWAKVARAIGRRAAPAVAAAAAAWVGWLLVMGFASYLFGLLFGVVALAIVVESRPMTARRVAALAVVVAVGVAAHVVAVAHVCLFVAIAAASRGRAVAVRTAAVLAAAAVAAAIIVWSSAFGSEMFVVNNEATAWRWGTLADRLRDFVGITFVGYSGLGWLLSAATLAAVGVSVAAHRAGPRSTRYVGVALGCGVALALAAPTQGFGWAYVAQRLMLVPLLLGVAALPAGRLGRSVGVVVVLAAAIATVGAVPRAVEEGARVRDTVATFGGVDAGRMYAVLFDDGRRLPAPWAMTDIGVAGYALLAGGTSPAAFATSPVMHVAIYRDTVAAIFPGARTLFHVEPACEPPEAPMCAERATAVAERVALHALAFDSVVAVHAPASFGERLEARGYGAVAPAVWTLQPTSLRVTMPAGSTPAPTVAQLVLGADEVFAQADFAQEGSGDVVAVFGRTLAGPVSLRVGAGEALLGTVPLTLEPGAARTVELGRR